MFCFECSATSRWFNSRICVTARQVLPTVELPGEGEYSACSDGRDKESLPQTAQPGTSHHSFEQLEGCGDHHGVR